MERDAYMLESSQSRFCACGMYSNCMLQKSHAAAVGTAKLLDGALCKSGWDHDHFMHIHVLRGGQIIAVCSALKCPGLRL